MSGRGKGKSIGKSTRNNRSRKYINNNCLIILNFSNKMKNHY